MPAGATKIANTSGGQHRARRITNFGNSERVLHQGTQVGRRSPHAAVVALTPNRLTSIVYGDWVISAIRFILYQEYRIQGRFTKPPCRCRSGDRPPMQSWREAAEEAIGKWLEYHDDVPR